MSISDFDPRYVGTIDISSTSNELKETDTNRTTAVSIENCFVVVQSGTVTASVQLLIDSTEIGVATLTAGAVGKKAYFVPVTAYATAPTGYISTSQSLLAKCKTTGTGVVKTYLATANQDYA